MNPVTPSDGPLHLTPQEAGKIGPFFAAVSVRAQSGKSVPSIRPRCGDTALLIESRRFPGKHRKSKRRAKETATNLVSLAPKMISFQRRTLSAQIARQIESMHATSCFTKELLPVFFLTDCFLPPSSQHLFPNRERSYSIALSFRGLREEGKTDAR